MNVGATHARMVLPVKTTQTHINARVSQVQAAITATLISTNVMHRYGHVRMEVRAQNRDHQVHRLASTHTVVHVSQVMLAMRVKLI